MAGLALLHPCLLLWENHIPSSGWSPEDEGQIEQSGST